MRKNLGESSKNVSYSKMAENSWSGQQATEEIVVTHEQGACRARSRVVLSRLLKQEF